MKFYGVHDLTATAATYFLYLMMVIPTTLNMLSKSHAGKIVQFKA